MEGSSDCTMSLSRWQRLTAAKMRKTTRAAAGPRLVAPLERNLLPEQGSC